MDVYSLKSEAYTTVILHIIKIKRFRRICAFLRVCLVLDEGCITQLSRHISVCYLFKELFFNISPRELSALVCLLEIGTELRGQGIR